jgi:hypothetical protein
MPVNLLLVLHEHEGVTDHPKPIEEDMDQCKPQHRRVWMDKEVEWARRLA